MGEVKDGRRRRRQSVIYFARRQLEGGVLDVDGLGMRACQCQKCGGVFRLKSEFDPCAFCPDCKDGLMDMFAEAVVNAAKPRRRRTK